MNLLFDFTVDKARKRYSLRENLLPTYLWYGMPLPKQKCLTSG